jgi:hypothetical protein
LRSALMQMRVDNCPGMLEALLCVLVDLSTESRSDRDKMHKNQLNRQLEEAFLATDVLEG